MPALRQEVCRSTSRKLTAALPTLASVKAAVGLDGFVDEIISVVDKRQNFQLFEGMRTIPALGSRISAAAGKSINLELVVKQMKLGGNGPIMANALASIGLNVTYMGAVGFPTLHPVFEEMSRRATVISIAEPGHTDALEFEDGKVMMGKLASMNEVNWGNLQTRVGAERFASIIEAAQLIAFVNWTMLPYMDEIWKKMIESKLLTRSAGSTGKTGRTFFCDLCDPEKRTAADISEAMGLLSKFQEQVDVVLGLNLKEAGEIAEVLGLPIGPDPEAAIEQTARDIRAKLNLACVVVHPRRGAAAATAAHTASFAGPFVKQPKISTGAGDHFNAGFCLGRLLGFELAECLCLGVATSGYYVRNAQSATGEQLADFIANLPEPQ
jgi:sugar/nucleoside kinase (ribokinase family)